MNLVMFFCMKWILIYVSCTWSNFDYAGKGNQDMKGLNKVSIERRLISVWYLGGLEHGIGSIYKKTKRQPPQSSKIQISNVWCFSNNESLVVPMHKPQPIHHHPPMPKNPIPLPSVAFKALFSTISLSDVLSGLEACWSCILVWSLSPFASFTKNRKTSQSPFLNPFIAYRQKKQTVRGAN